MIAAFSIRLVTARFFPGAFADMAEASLGCNGTDRRVCLPQQLGLTCDLFIFGAIQIDDRGCMRYHDSKICAAVNGGDESVFCIWRNGAFLSAAKGQAALRGH